MPSLVAPQMAMYGANRESKALTNWPSVSVEASLSPLTNTVSSGFRDTCIKVLPIPRKAKEMTISTRRGGADQIDEAHDEEREHHRRDFTRPALPVLLVSLLILNSLFLYCNETMNC